MIYTKYKLKNCEYKQQIRNFAFCIDNEKFLIYDWLVPQVRTRGRWKNAAVFGLAGRETGGLRRVGDPCRPDRAFYRNCLVNISVNSVASKAVANDTAIGNHRLFSRSSFQYRFRSER